MTDDRSHRSDEDDVEGSAGTSSGGLEPGGGPQRVVSERSVDDILDSLDESAPDNESEDGSRSNEPEDDSPRVETTSETDDDESTGPEGSGVVAFDEERVPETIDEPERRASSDGRGETVPANDAGGESGTDRDGETAGEDRTVDHNALEARIARGDVTGADVRAAEAGEGRDPSPEIDEVDLSLDDLETASPSTKSYARSTGDTAPTDGDAARIEGDTAQLEDSEAGADTSAGSADDEGASDSTGGVIGRIKDLFSG
ncbi:hypothetical protein [Natrialba swarupiae]|uniref:Uncharacterized protein n=1 Tax=Natrialba swarupiae TaxID=2448032 RepID=A0A5D5AK40_9EURY|nr:hypothetical protein [Natrialba swarupiae]TYT61323.1 hypothetical protein FYC77_14020 [Natrialba swarupiae]